MSHPTPRDLCNSEQEAMKQRYWRVWTAAAVISMLGGPALLVAQDAAPRDDAKGAQPRLELSAKQWDFGEVWQGEPLKFELTIKNVGDAPLIFHDVKSSCGCTVPTDPESPLAPGASDVVTVTFDAVKRTGRQRQTITFVSNDPRQKKIAGQSGRYETPFVVRGFVKPMYQMKPDNSISFGLLYRNSDETRTVLISNAYTEDMNLELKPDQDFGDYEITLRTVSEGKQYSLTAKTKPPMKVGAARGKAILKTGWERLPEIRVLMFGSVQPPIKVTPDKLLMLKRSKSTITRTLEVWCSPAQPVKIVAAKSTVPAIRVEIREVEPDKERPAKSTQEIVVHLPPGADLPDDAEPKIELRTDSDVAEYETITVPIRVIGS